MNICVIISSHSPSIYTKLTISTLLRAVQNNHNLNIHIGVHSNYSDYTSDLSLFKDLKGIDFNTLVWKTNSGIDYWVRTYDVYLCNSRQDLF